MRNADQMMYNFDLKGSEVGRFKKPFSTIIGLKSHLALTASRKAVNSAYAKAGLLN